MKSILGVLLMLMMGSLPAWAALGNDEASVNTDVQALSGQHRLVANAGYNLHEITTADGSVVREFASPGGKVFGVSWQGHSMPKLTQLLGAHMADFQQAQRTQVVQRRAVTIQGADFVFTSFGHLRSFRGRVYVPSLIPANLTAEVVQ